MKIRYFLKYEPKNTVKLGRQLMKIGGIFLILFLLLLILIDGLPIDSHIPFVFETMPLFDVLLTIGLVLFIPGLILTTYTKWQSGQLAIEDDIIKITGHKTISIPSIKILSIKDFKNDRRRIQIDSKAYDISIQFANETACADTFKLIKKMCYNMV